MRAYDAAKCDCGRGSVPDPAVGAYSAPPDSLVGFKGAAGKGKNGNGRKRRGGEASWNRAADWL